MEKSLILTKAQNAATAHDWLSAARFYKELLKEDGNNEEYLNAIGSIYSRAGEDVKAIPYYERIINNNPKNFDAMISLGGIYRRLKRYNDAVNILLKALNVGGNVADIEYNLGFTYKEMGDYQDAVESFESVIEKNPDDVLAYNHLGSIYFDKKDYEKSIAEYKRGLQVDQNHPVLNYNLARSYVESKNYPEAVKCFEAALKTRPGWIDAIRDFSKLLIKCQHTKHAQELVEQSIKLHPNDIDLLCMLGKIYLNQFDYDNATKTYKHANQMRENDINILISLAESLEKNKNFDDAVVTINDALELDSSNVDAQKRSAHMLLSTQKYEKALETIKKADVETGNKDPEVFDLYGQYFICRGDDEAANSYYQKIEKLEQPYSDYLLNAAERYVQTGNFNKAIDCAKQYIERNPKVPDGYNSLGNVQLEIGDLIGAKKTYEKSLKFHNPNIYACNELKKINETLFKEDETLEETQSDSSDNDEHDSTEHDTEKDLSLEEQNPDDFDYDQMGDDSAIEDIIPNDDEFWENFADDTDKQQEGEHEQTPDPKLKQEDWQPLEAEQEHEQEQTPEQAPEEIAQLQAEDDEAVENSEKSENTENESATAGENEEIQEHEDSDISNIFDDSNFAEPAGDALSEDEGFDFSKFDDDNKTIEETPLEAPGPIIEQEQELENYLDSVKGDSSTLPFDNSMNPVEHVGNPSPVQNPNLRNFTPPVESAPIFSQAQEIAQSALDTARKAANIAEDAVKKSENRLAENKQEEQAVSAQNPQAPEPKVSPEPEVTTKQSDSPEPDDLLPEQLLDNVIEAQEEKPEADKLSETSAHSESTAAKLEHSIEKGDVIAEQNKSAPSNPNSNFLTVDEVISGKPERQECVEECPECIESPEPSELQTQDTELKIDSDITPDEMLKKIELILNDSDAALENADKIELFKTLKELSKSLPEEERNSFASCRMRIKIEYLIGKLSGKPGLLLTAESLLKSGVLGSEFNSQLNVEYDKKISNHLIKKVIKLMQKLSQNLEDKEAANDLRISGDGMLEKIELENEKSRIFCDE